MTTMFLAATFIGRDREHLIPNPNPPSRRAFTIPMRGTLAPPGTAVSARRLGNARHRRRSGGGEGDQSLAQLDRAAINAGNALAGQGGRTQAGATAPPRGGWRMLLPASDLMRFQQRYEQSAQPFEWTFTRRDPQVLLAKLRAKPDHLAA